LLITKFGLKHISSSAMKNRIFNLKPFFLTGLLLASAYLGAKANEYYTLDEALKNPHDVTVLNLDYDPLFGASEAITTLPDEILIFKNLRVLSLRKNKLKDLPGCIAKLPKLEEIFLENNELESLPYCIYHAASLKKLSLNNNRIDTLLPEIGNLRTLEELIISNNSIHALPEELFLLDKLKVLEVNNNRLTEINMVILLLNLESLNISGNLISQLPAEFGKLGQLKTLNISGNQLKELPQSVENLFNLENLEAAFNQLTALPSMANFQKLLTLNIGGNAILSLPKDFGKAVHLQIFYAWNNQLESLPASINQLDNLFQINLYNNKLTTLDLEPSKLKALQFLMIGGNSFSQETLAEIENRFKQVTIFI
jgi:Leucine-rich repeat (LRR) protein